MLLRIPRRYRYENKWYVLLVGTPARRRRANKVSGRAWLSCGFHRPPAQVCGSEDVIVRVQQCCGRRLRDCRLPA